MHGFYSKFQAIYSATVVIASQLIKPSPFSSLWGGSVSVDLFCMIMLGSIIYYFPSKVHYKTPYHWRKSWWKRVPICKYLKKTYSIKSIEKSYFGFYVLLFYAWSHAFSHWVGCFEQLSGMLQTVEWYFMEVWQGTAWGVLNSAGILWTVYAEGVITDYTGCCKHYVGLFEQFIRCTIVLWRTYCMKCIQQQ
jgi:hypothetical protein